MARSNMLLPLVGSRMYWFKNNASMDWRSDITCSCSVFLPPDINSPLGHCSLGKLKSPMISMSGFKWLISFVVVFTASSISVNACFGQSGGVDIYKIVVYYVH